MNNILNNNLCVKEIRKGCKDNFHSFMVENEIFDGYYDIPFINQSKKEIKINKLVAYDQTKNHFFEDGEVVHFYLDDQKFDGPNGIWNGIRDNKEHKKGFNLERLKGASAIIAPDFSLYLDMPRCMQIWNVYRSRAVGCYLNKLGFNIIPNIRWTDEESYRFAFDGIARDSIVAIGTLGCSKNKNDKFLFLNGFLEMIKRINPRLIIIYGNIIDELQIIIKKFNLNILHFDSNSHLYFEGKKNGIKK